MLVATGEAIGVVISQSVRDLDAVVAPASNVMFETRWVLGGEGAQIDRQFGLRLGHDGGTGIERASGSLTDLCDVTATRS